MKKIILFLSLFTFVVLDVTITIKSQVKCQFRHMLRIVEFSIKIYPKLSINLLYLPDIIPFSLELKSEKSVQKVKTSCFKQTFYDFAYCYILSDFLDDFSNYNVSKIKSNYNIE